KFLRALPTKWRLKVTAIEESKDLSTLPLDELIGNLKVYEVVLEKDSETSKNKKEKYKSLALKAKKVSSDEEVSYSGVVMKNMQWCDCPKHSFNDQKAFIRGCWSDSEEEDDSKKDKIYLMALYNNEVRLKSKLEPDEWIKDKGCSRHMTGNKYLFSTYEAINGGNVVFGSNTKSKIIGKDLRQKIQVQKGCLIISISTDHGLEIDNEVQFGAFCDANEIQIEDIKEMENGPLNKEIINIKESKDHLIEMVIEPKNIKEAIKDKSWTMAMQEELNQFVTNDVWSLVPPPKNQTVIEMLKKFGIEDSKPIKTPMSSETKLTRDEDEESADDTKYRGMIGSLLYLAASPLEIMFSVCLCLWYPKGTGVETIVYADSDHAGGYVDRKSTSGVCTFMGCCLTSWFSKKQTALAISTTETEYVFARKDCQQALWMKQALVDYDIKLDDIPVLCDNKGAIDLCKNPILHSRTKHIEIRHHFLLDNVKKGNILI
ncbi:hypothetical protein Tco_0393710, partial [Tanacetum coccineum]